MTFIPTALGGLDVDRFGVKKTQEWFWLPTISASNLTPSTAEVNAGKGLTCAIEAINGFKISPKYADLADLCSDVDGKVFDGATLDDSSITFYLKRTSTGDALDFFDVGDLGYVMHAPYGAEPTLPGWVWKVEVSMVTPMVATAGGALGTVGFAVVAYRKVVIPADAS